MVHAAAADGRPEAVSGLDTTFFALSDPTRRAVIGLLRKGPLRAGELAASLQTSAPAMSRHLRVLRESGLLEEVEQGGDARVRTYQLRPEPFAELRHWLDEVEDFWSAELDAFKEYAERTRGRKKR